MQNRLQQRRHEFATLPPEKSPMVQAIKAVVALMGWSAPPSSAASETLPLSSAIGPIGKEDPRQPSNPTPMSKSDRSYERLSETEKAEVLTGLELLSQRSPQVWPAADAQAPALQESTKTSTSTPRTQVSEEDLRSAAEAAVRTLNLAWREVSRQQQSKTTPASKSDRAYQRLSADAKARVLADFKSLQPQWSSPSAVHSRTANRSPDSSTPSPSGPPPKKSARVN
jgi:hypothetical protein